MDRPQREKFLPKKLRDNEKDAKEMEPIGIEKKLNKVSKNKLRDVKSIVCSQIYNNAIRFQCSHCNLNYARKASLNIHVKQKHQGKDHDPEIAKKAKNESDVKENGTGTL